MAEITLKGASMTYPNGTKALTDVDLTVRDHEFMVLLGPSGCGKSTLLRLVAGLEKPTAGEVLFDGQVVNELEPLKRNVAMVFQSFALYPHLNVYKNMAFPLKSMKLKPEEIQRRVEEAAKILGIEHVLNRRPRVLSGGQRQRVALGRAMVREPVVFLLDEPLSNLDVKMRLELRDQIVALHKRLGTTFLYVTHDQAEAMQLGDRLAIMDTGRVVQIGSPQEIYDYPNSLYVADFVGAPKMNFFASLLRTDGQNWSVRLLGREFPLPAERIDADAAGFSAVMRVIVGVRPEDFQPSQREDAYTAAVGQVMPMGATLHVEAYIGNQRFLVVLNNHTPICEGDALRLEVDPRTVHLFAAEGGQNLLLPPRKGGKA